MFADDAPDCVAEDLQTLSLDEATDIAASQAVEFEIDLASDAEQDAQEAQEELTELAESAEEQTEESEAGLVGTSALRSRLATYYSSDEFVKDVVVESSTDTLRQKTTDDAETKAFKAIFSEYIRVKHSSALGASDILCHDGNGHITSRPSQADWRSDVLLCGKRALSLVYYRVLAMMAETDFECWHELPESLRTQLMHEVGSMLIRRNVVTRSGNIGAYWKKNATRLEKNRFNRYARVA